jgi:Icc-related predicted phosphoesterase
MRIGAISDLHGFLPPIPSGLDLLLVAGDIGFFEKDGRKLEAFSQPQHTVYELEDWLSNAGCPVVAIAGNHDFALEAHESLARSLPWTYLKDSGAEFEGMKIYGTPWIPVLVGWAFYATEPELEAAAAAIPSNTDILLTHSPPHGILDKVGHKWGTPGDSVGCRPFRQRVMELPNLKLHVFGHIHNNPGPTGLPGRDTIFDNVAFCGGTREYDPTGEVRIYNLSGKD